MQNSKPLRKAKIPGDLLGRGVEADHDQAIAWLRKAVDQWETSDPLKLWIVESPNSIKPYPEAVGASAAVQIAEDTNIIDDSPAGENETQIADPQTDEPVVEETVRCAERR